MAAFVMQVLGCEVAALNTVHFSTIFIMSINFLLQAQLLKYHFYQATTQATGK